MEVNKFFHRYFGYAVGIASEMIMEQCYNDSRVEKLTFIFHVEGEDRSLVMNKKMDGRAIDNGPRPGVNKVFLKTVAKEMFQLSPLKLIMIMGADDRLLILEERPPEIPYPKEMEIKENKMLDLYEQR